MTPDRRRLVLMGSGKATVFLTPRDWSPRIELMKWVLRETKREVPKLFLAGVKELNKTGYQDIASLVQQGFGFVMKIYGEYHLVSVQSDGKIQMSPRAKEALNVFKDWRDGVPKGFKYEIVRRPW